MATRYGTSHFIDLKAAIAYHRLYGTDAEMVATKIKEGEIHIGKPTLKPGQQLLRHREEGRYYIQEAD